MVYIKQQIGRLNQLPFISGIIVILNVIISLICTFTGNLLYNIGSVGVLDLAQGEYYRLITSMFLHADAHHLVNNMLLTFGIGYMIEKEIGHVRFGIYYMAAGVCGNILSAYIEVLTGDYISSIGASGGVFGLDGVLLALVLFSGKRISTVTLPRLLFMIGYSLYNGFTADNINNAAHVGGLVAGFVMASLLCLMRRIRGTYIGTDGRTEEKNEY